MVVRQENQLAQLISSQRLTTFIAIAAPKLLNVAGTGALTDPDFQMNITEAGRSAVRTDSLDDHELLVKILEERAKIAPTPRHKLGTRKALETIGQLSDVDIATLTLIWTVLSLIPVEHSIESALKRMDDEYAALVPIALQANNSWIYDLSALGCIFGGTPGLNYLKSFKQLVATNKYSGFFCSGMDAAEATKAKSNLNKIKPGLATLVVKHALDADRYCLFGRDKNDTRERITALKGKKLTERQNDLLEKVFQLNKYDQLSPDYEMKLEELLVDYPNLKKVSDWWGVSILPSMQITPAGLTVAYSNYRRINPSVTVPSLQACMETI
jgi:hypothetical protein